MYRICLVCLGNICRSPMAEVVLRAELDRAGLADRVSVESAGTGDWHIGAPMDKRARAELDRRGYDGSGHQARQFEPAWFGDFDLIAVMDRSNLRDVLAMAPGEDAAQRVRLFRQFDPVRSIGTDDSDIPDPYYGEPAKYALVFDLAAGAARGLVAQLAARLSGEPAAG